MTTHHHSPPAIPPGAARLPLVSAARLWWWLALAIGLLGPGRAAEAPPQPGAELPYRVGFSRGMFRGVNENDARASLRTYAAAMSRDAHLPVEPDPVLFEGVAELRTLLGKDAMDTISLPIEEFFAMEEGLLPSPLLASTVDGQFTEEYVLAVHRDGGIARVADLRGRRILLLENIRCSLAPHWLAVLLATERLGPPAAFFGEMIFVAKPARVALPVFFRQEAACVITRRGLAVLGELNPQVAAQMRVLAVSPKVVPAITCFRANLVPAEVERITAAVSRSHLWPAGKQVMTIFQCDRVEAQPASLLDSTRELWAAYRRLPPSGQLEPVHPTPPVPPHQGVTP